MTGSPNTIQKDETPGVMAEGFKGDESAARHFAADASPEQAPRSPAKRLADVTAMLAIRGFSLELQPDRTLLLSRWNMSRTLPSIEPAEQFLGQVGGADHG